MSFQLTENRWFACVAAAATATAWALMLVGGPVLAGQSGPFAGTLYALGSLVCHQQPERSFHWGAAQLPVCARCLGLYLGAAGGLVIWTATSRRRHAIWPRSAALLALLASALPTGVSVLSAWGGLGDPANAWRAAMALPLGVAGALIVGAAITDHLK